MEGVRMPTSRRPDPAGGGRVSPTATADQSASNNVWRLISRDPEIREAIHRGQDQINKGQSARMSDLRRELGLEDSGGR